MLDIVKGILAGELAWFEVIFEVDAGKYALDDELI